MIEGTMLVGLSLAMSMQNGSVPKLPTEFRGVWVATVDNIDWPTKPGLSTTQQKLELLRIIDKASELKLNAIIFQVRPHADAMYPSDIEPWSWYLTGEQGRAPNPVWDPLEFAVEESHKRGIELHVWFNPYRVFIPAQKGSFASNNIAITNPEETRSYGMLRWMDPGSKFVQDRTYNVFIDVLNRYDIDGVHIDDYFYPYPITDTSFPDSQTYAAYTSTGGQLSRSDWRRKNVDDLVSKVYLGIKYYKPWVKFGISPFGIYRPGIPKGIQAGIDQYEELSADALKWLKNGWCDYFTPQLYWPIEQTPQAFGTLLAWWDKENVKKRHLWPGLYTVKVGSASAWGTSQILRQIRLDRVTTAEDPGTVHFSMVCFLKNQASLNDSLMKSVYSWKAVVPDSPWLSRKPAPMPPGGMLVRTGSSWTITFVGLPEGGRFFAYQIESKPGHWVTHDVTSVPAHAFPETVKRIAVRIIDRFGTQSDPVTYDIPASKSD